MAPMVCHFSHLELMGSAGTDIHDVTPQARAALARARVDQGPCTRRRIVVPHPDDRPRERGE